MLSSNEQFRRGFGSYQVDVVKRKRKIESLRNHRQSKNIPIQGQSFCPYYLFAQLTTPPSGRTSYSDNNKATQSYQAIVHSNSQLLLLHFHYILTIAFGGTGDANYVFVCCYVDTFFPSSNALFLHLSVTSACFLLTWLITIPLHTAPPPSFVHPAWIGGWMAGDQ